MLRLLRNKKGQNTAEYAVVIALVIGAAVAMQTDLKRNLQGGIKHVVDRGKQDGSLGQYEPYYLRSDYSTKTSKHRDTVETETGGGVKRVYGADSLEKEVTRTGTQTMLDATDAD